MLTNFCHNVKSNSAWDTFWLRQGEPCQLSKNVTGSYGSRPKGRVWYLASLSRGPSSPQIGRRFVGWEWAPHRCPHWWCRGFRHRCTQMILFNEGRRIVDVNMSCDWLGVNIHVHAAISQWSIQNLDSYNTFCKNPNDRFFFRCAISKHYALTMQGHLLNISLPVQ